MIVDPQLLTSVPTIEEGRLKSLLLKSLESFPMGFIGEVDPKGPLRLGGGGPSLVGHGSGFSF